MLRRKRRRLLGRPPPPPRPPHEFKVPIMPDDLRLEARLSRLSHAALVSLVCEASRSNHGVAATSNTCLARHSPLPDWAVRDVLLDPDLIACVLSHVHGGSAAARVCTAWRTAWDTTDRLIYGLGGGREAAGRACGELLRLVNRSSRRPQQPIDDNRTRVAQHHGGIEALVALVRPGPTTATITNLALRVLRSLAKTPAVPERIIEAGGVQNMIAVLRQVTFFPNDPFESKRLATQLLAACTSLHPPARTAVCEAQGIPQLAKFALQARRLVGEDTSSACAAAAVAVLQCAASVCRTEPPDDLCLSVSVRLVQCDPQLQFTDGPFSKLMWKLLAADALLALAALSTPDMAPQWRRVGGTQALAALSCDDAAWVDWSSRLRTPSGEPRPIAVKQLADRGLANLGVRATRSTLRSVRVGA